MTQNPEAPMPSETSVSGLVERLNIGTALVAKMLSTRTVDDQPNRVKLPDGTYLHGEGAELIFAMLGAFEVMGEAMSEAAAILDRLEVEGLARVLCRHRLAADPPPNATGLESVEEFWPDHADQAQALISHLLGERS